MNDYGPRTAHATDPRADIEPLVDLADRAQQEVFQKLLEGSYCKVRVEDVLEKLDSAHQLELLARLVGLSLLHGVEALEQTEILIRDATQHVHDYLEGCGSWLVERRAEEIAEEEAREAEEEWAP